MVPPSAAGSGASGLPFVFSVVSSLCIKDSTGPEDCGLGVFVAGVDGVGRKGSGDTRTVGVETLLGAYLNNFWTWDYLSQLLKDQDFCSISFCNKGILLYLSS